MGVPLHWRNSTVVGTRSLGGAPWTAELDRGRATQHLWLFRVRNSTDGRETQRSGWHDQGFLGGLPPD